MSLRDVPASVPGVPRDADGPVFAEPWQAQAFAMAVHLHDKGLFTWSEWADTLGAQIRKAQAEGDCDAGDTYYNHWLAALETIVIAKGVTSSHDLHDKKDAWDRAARATPHGKPILLDGRER